ncbi:MAG TPA: site-specific DNA-methyltransferase, partial [Candidatus Dormibacteraeota bacterium]|nr:site-specific DNA-methyltransferase [Candidatus Dormibacteraeota bacterium]
MAVVAVPAAAGAGLIVHGEALDLLRQLPDGCAGLVYADPPFNTGGRRDGFRLRTTRDAGATRRGFGGATYRTDRTDTAGYDDS